MYVVRNVGEPFKFAREYVAFQAAGLTLKTSKLVFGPKSVVYLGHAISDEGVAVGEDRIKALQELLTPTCIEDLRSVLGVMNFVRRFVPNYAEITARLVDHARKDFATRPRFKKAWSSAQSTAFAHVKRFLVSAPVLNFPDYERELFVRVYASELGVGAFFAQTSKND